MNPNLRLFTIDTQLRPAPVVVRLSGPLIDEDKSMLIAKNVRKIGLAPGQGSMNSIWSRSWDSWPGFGDNVSASATTTNGGQREGNPATKKLIAKRFVRRELPRTMRIFFFRQSSTYANLFLDLLLLFSRRRRRAKRSAGGSVPANRLFVTMEKLGELHIGAGRVNGRVPNEKR